MLAALKNFMDPLLKSAPELKERLKTELQLVASVGVAPNKFLAKLASDQDKPDGYTVIESSEVQQFLDPLPVGRIWGVGKAAQQRMHRLGIQSVKDLRQNSRERLEDEFGKIGKRLWELSQGIDYRPVVTDSETKSISHETTFGEDVASLSTLQSVGLSLTEGVCFRLRRAKLKARTVNLKVRYHDFSTVTRSVSLKHPTDSTIEIWRGVDNLLIELLKGKNFAIRLIGAGVSNFGNLETDSAQLDLFETKTKNEDDTDTKGKSACY